MSVRAGSRTISDSQARNSVTNIYILYPMCKDLKLPRDQRGISGPTPVETERSELELAVDGTYRREFLSGFPSNVLVGDGDLNAFVVLQDMTPRDSY
jgi:hypothetical protein